MMAGIKGKNTRPEMLLRRGLHQRGFRFRLHFAGLSGHPDLFLRKYHAVIFVLGCYGHRHKNCRFATTPKSRGEFWLTKFKATVERDSRNQNMLKEQGWRVAIIWECFLRPKQANITIDTLDKWLKSNETCLELGQL
jgi:DNA mismatch endonuclease (patch repair protein)